MSPHKQKQVLDKDMPERKVAVFGIGGVGKSALTIRYIINDFKDFYDPTIEDCYIKQQVIDNQICKVNILDTAGQDIFAALRVTHVPAREGFILVFDLVNPISLTELCDVRSDILRIKDKPKEEIPMVLVGNKCDLDYDPYLDERAAKLAEEWKIPYIRASAKTDENVKDAFITIVREIRRLNAFIKSPNPYRAPSPWGKFVRRMVSCVRSRSRD